MKRSMIAVVSVVAVMLAAAAPTLAVTQTGTITFTAGQVKSTMNGYGAPLNDTNYLWGLFGVRAMPIVGGSGAYAITSGSTTHTGWAVAAPDWWDWSDPTPYGFTLQDSPYGAFKYAAFLDLPGAENPGQPATPLYMILDRPANEFNSMTFNASGWPYGFLGYTPPVEYKEPGYDNGAGGTNLVTAMDDSTAFSFGFQYDDQDASWDGSWQFVVDGMKFHRIAGDYVGKDNVTYHAEAGDPTWNNNFFGSFEWLPYYELGGGLAGNVEGGYVVPEPATMALVALGGVGLLARRRRGK